MAERGTVAIVGATSAIARDVAAALAARRYSLLLLARRVEEADDIAADIRVRYSVSIATASLDVLQLDASMLRALLERVDSLAGVLIAVGYLGNEELAISDSAEAERIESINHTGVVNVLDVVAGVMEKRRGGFIAAFSSVAGDRPRRRVMHYGSAKASLNAHLARLRARLRPANVRVITIKPGPVDTRMPYGPRRQPLMVSPGAVADEIADALERNDGDVYVPAKWRWIMLAIRAIPAPVFRRLDV